MNNTKLECINISCWNCRGLVTSIPYLKELMKESDVISLSEHWLQPNRLCILNEISDDFNVISRSSKYADSSNFGYKRGQGGVALFWRKTIKGISPITNSINDRICGIRYQSNGGRLINIYSLYLPSPGSQDDYSAYIDFLADTISNNERGVLSIVFDDMNGDVGHLGGSRSHRPPNKLRKVVAKFFREFSLVPMNMKVGTKGPLNTFRGSMGSSTLDYIAVPQSLEGNVSDCQVIDEDILNNSDHLAVTLCLSIEGIMSSYIKPKASRIKWGKINPDMLKEWYRDPTGSFCLDLFDEGRLDVNNPELIDEVIDKITKRLSSLSNKLPRYKFRKHLRPFWNETLTWLKREKVKF